VRGGKILVAGATGRVGGAALKHLLDSGFEARALVRGAGKGEALRALGAEVVVGDVTHPETLPPALEGCAGIFSALSATTDKQAREVEYRGNVELLSAARQTGVRRLVYSSALHADHPLGREVGTFREKARFEEALLVAEDISATVLRPAMFMETLLMALKGPVAFIMGPQRQRVRWISTHDVALAAVRSFERAVAGRHELAGPDAATFDEAYRLLSAVRGGRIFVLHPPLPAVRLAGRFSPTVEELAEMFTVFDAVGYETNPAPLRDVFGVEALTIEGWARRVFGQDPFG
jgi:uncharacterized protein YbjT (DUF2867 family)